MQQTLGLFEIFFVYQTTQNCSPVTVESYYDFIVESGVVCRINTTVQFHVLFQTLSLDVCSFNDNAMQRTMAACKGQRNMLSIS